MNLADNVLATVADAEDTEVKNLEPLGEAIDPEALDALFEPGGPSATRQHGIVVFSYMDYTVMVASNGDVTLE